MKTIAIIISFLISFNAFSTQCQFISRRSADKAVDLIEKSQKNAGGVLELCQYCRDEKSITLKNITDIDIGSSGVREMPSDLWVNGELVDLAYLFVKLDKDKNTSRWSNLGLQIGCIIYGSPAYLMASPKPYL